MPAPAAVAAVLFTAGTTSFAIAEAAVVGVYVGAVIGGATAAVSGGDIFKGALKGAVVGGISGGALKGMGILTGLSPVASAATTGAPVAKGATDASVSLIEGASGTTPNLFQTDAALNTNASFGSAAAPAKIITPAAASESFFAKNPMMAAGLTTGVGQGLVMAASASAKEEGDREREDAIARQRTAERNAGQPAKWTPPRINIAKPVNLMDSVNITDNKYVKYFLDNAKKGLLQEATA
jgi:hypothetical protein